MNDDSLPFDLDQIRDSPLWHFHDYDLALSNFWLVRVDRALFRHASFLDERISRHAPTRVRYQLQHLSTLFPATNGQRSPIAFIFHIGHCGSTLLSRALAVAERILPVREPLCVRSLANDERELNRPTSLLSVAQWRGLLTSTLDALARKFHEEDLNLIKATSTCNNLLAAVLSEDAKTRILLLFVPLRSYLAGMLGKPEPPPDLRRQAKTRMLDWMRIPESTPLELYRLDDPQLAALAWMGGMYSFAEALESYPDRLLLVDFEKVLIDPVTRLREVAEHLCLGAVTTEIVTGFPRVSASYAKQPGVSYTPDTRARILQQAHRERAAEILTAMKWAERLIHDVPALARCGDYLE